MFNDILDYFERLYFKPLRYAIAMLLFSAVCAKWNLVCERDIFKRMRPRMNTLFTWAHSWFKSNVVGCLANLLPHYDIEDEYILPSKRQGPFKFFINVTSNMSGAAFRGSFNASHEFYPPEIALSDIIVINELQTLTVSDDKSLFPTLLQVLEEGNIRIALIKASGGDKAAIKAKAAKYGLGFVADRLVYDNRCSIWASTHTLDIMRPENRGALITRFVMMHLDETEISHERVDESPFYRVDLDKENQFKIWLSQVFARNENPDFEFGRRTQIEMNKKMDKYKRNWKDETNPREVNDWLRMYMAYHYIDPTLSEVEVANFIFGGWIRRHNPGLVQKEVIGKLICKNPMTIKEIMDETGFNISTIMTCLSRLGAIKTKVGTAEDRRAGRCFMKYSLDRIPYGPDVIK